MGETALHCAIRENEVEVAKAVIEAGVHVNVQDFYHRTALHEAAQLNRLAIGKMLLGAGADLNVKGLWRRGQVSVRKLTALEIAKKDSQEAFAEMLRKNMRLK